MAESYWCLIDCKVASLTAIWRVSFWLRGACSLLSHLLEPEEAIGITQVSFDDSLTSARHETNRRRLFVLSLSSLLFGSMVSASELSFLFVVVVPLAGVSDCEDSYGNFHCSRFFLLLFWKLN